MIVLNQLARSFHKDSPLTLKASTQRRTFVYMSMAEVVQYVRMALQLLAVME